MPISLVEKYGSKICSNASGAMPGPVSATSKVMLFFCGRSVILSAPPSAIACTALIARFEKQVYASGDQPWADSNDALKAVPNDGEVFKLTTARQERRTLISYGFSKLLIHFFISSSSKIASLTFFRPGRLRGRRPRAVFVRVLAVNRPLNLRHMPAFVIHRHRVTRDVEADVSYEPHSIPLWPPAGVAAFDEAVADVPVSAALTAAIARRVLQDFRMARCEGVHRSHLFNRLGGRSSARQWRPGRIPGSVLQNLPRQPRRRRGLSHWRRSFLPSSGCVGCLNPAARDKQDEREPEQRRDDRERRCLAQPLFARLFLANVFHRFLRSLFDLLIQYRL
jgi:hypothetical protein